MVEAQEYLSTGLNLGLADPSIQITWRQCLNQWPTVELVAAAETD